MLLVEIHNISKADEYFEMLDNFCFKAKNLYNNALYSTVPPSLKTNGTGTNKINNIIIIDTIIITFFFIKTPFI